jgi:hypothetical protein
VPSYVACRWHHDLDDEPVLLYEELDADRYETRKVHEYRDGRLVRSDRIALELGTSLSPEALPSVSEIEAQPEFTVLPLTAEEFETVWAKASDAA